MSIYIQLGAGAGDQDHFANFRDGFSRYVKERDIANDDKIILVEANFFNLSTLASAWQDFPTAEISQIAITAGEYRALQEIDFFYVAEDAPFFQVASIKKSHVEKFYPDAEMLSFSVQAMEINEFLKEKCGINRIELLAIDIEGMDLLVMEDLDLSVFNIHLISFEKSHASLELKRISKKLKNFGYRRGGSGMDPHNSDVLWVKPDSLYEVVYYSIRHLRHRLWEIQIPLRHYLKSNIHKNI
jgi:hypothetical protein